MTKIIQRGVAASMEWKEEEEGEEGEEHPFSIDTAGATSEEWRKRRKRKRGRGGGGRRRWG